MGLFDFVKSKFSKEEPKADLTIENLNINCVFKYDLEDFKVTDVAEYDWGNGFKTKEYAVENSENTLYVHIAKKGGLSIDVSKEVSLNAIDKNIRNQIIEFDKPPTTIQYNGEEYHKTHDDYGYYSSELETEQCKFVNWVYHNAEENAFVSIMRWGETDFNATEGKYVKPFEFSDFLYAP